MKIEGKKLTVKFFANTESKPTVFLDDSLGSDTRNYPKEKLLYQLYIKVTYDKKSTRFSAERLKLNYPVPEEFDIDTGYNIADVIAKDLIKARNYIEQIVAFEKKILGNHFKLAGLGYRLEVYTNSLHDIAYYNSHKLKQLVEVFKIFSWKPFADNINEIVETITMKEYISFVDSLEEEKCMASDFLLDHNHTRRHTSLSNPFYRSLMIGLILANVKEYL